MNPQYVTQFIETLPSAFHAGDPDVANKTAEAENVRILQEFYRALARGDFAAALESLEENVTLEILGTSAVPFLGRWQGRAEVGKVLAENFAQLEDQKPQMESVIAQGDTVVVVGQEQGRFRATGQTYDFIWAQLFTYRDGKVIHIREFVG